jgi:hypothetical protein
MSLFATTRPLPSSRVRSLPAFSLFCSSQTLTPSVQVLSFPVSSIFYYVATGEWIDLFSQEGQIKFLAFTAGWGALGGAIAQYRTVLTAAAITP